MRMRTISLHCFLVGVFVLLSVTFGIADERTSSEWRTVDLPFRAVNIEGLRNLLWVCGTNEGIAASSDSGASWKIKHNTTDGGILLNIDFANDKFGYASGTAGLFLTTEDGGETWVSHPIGHETILQASFADPQHGLIRTASSLLFTVDGGSQWSPVSSGENQENLKSFRYPFSLVTLDAAHMAVMLKQGSAQYEPQAFLFTTDSGKTWKFLNIPNVTLYSFLRVQGRYWAVGTEVIHKDQPGGGYSVPVALVSSDGDQWEHSVHDIAACKLEMCAVCKTEGCFDSSVEIARIFGDKTTFADFPAEKQLTSKWASTDSAICSVENQLRCAALKEALHFASPAGPAPVDVAPAALATSSGQGPRCLICSFDPIFIDKKVQGAFKIKLVVGIAKNGIVNSVEVDGAPGDDIKSRIQQQAEQWIFEPFLKDGAPVDVRLKTSVPINVIKPR